MLVPLEILKHSYLLNYKKKQEVVFVFLRNYFFFILFGLNQILSALSSIFKYLPRSL